jgi:hypothetical protein
LHAIDSGSDNLESRVLAEVGDFLQEVEKMEGKPFDVSRLIQTSHYNIISSLIFGKRFAHNDAKLAQLVDLLQEDKTIFPQQGILSNIEWLKYLPGDRFKVRRRRFLVDEILKIIQASVDEHKETLENPKHQDYIYSFLNEQKRRKLNNEDLTGFGGNCYLFILFKAKVENAFLICLLLFPNLGRLQLFLLIPVFKFFYIWCNPICLSV